MLLVQNRWGWQVPLLLMTVGLMLGVLTPFDYPCRRRPAGQ